MSEEPGKGGRARRRGRAAKVVPQRREGSTAIHPGAFVDPRAAIGAACEIGPGAMIGAEPQDRHFGGERPLPSSPGRTR